MTASPIPPLTNATHGPGELPSSGHASASLASAPWYRISDLICLLALAASISIWFIAIRAPLWLDETSSFWQISAGVREIMSRRGQVSAAYPYILWLATRITGTSEVGLRIPSILAMLAAVYLLFLTARRLFDREIALVTAAIFCVHPLVIFEAIDARPYAFASLAISASIFLLVELSSSSSLLIAALFGVCGGMVAHFQLLFGVVLLPVLALNFLLAKLGNWKTLWCQGAIALGAFCVIFLPVMPDFLWVLRSRQMYVFEKVSPNLTDLGLTVAPGWLVYIFGVTILVAAATKRLDLQSRLNAWRFFSCASVGVVPLLILYGVSAATPTNIFVERYRLVAVAGIALGWGLMLSRVDSRCLRTLCCVAVVATTAYQYFSSPLSRHHKYTWKYALELTEKSASPDNATVLICSDFPSSDYFPMPTGVAVKNSGFFTPLSYYKLSVPVVGLPRALNGEAMRIGSDFVAAHRRERFLALGWVPSYDTLHWLTSISSQTHDARVLDQPDGVVVLEFKPHTGRSE